MKHTLSVPSPIGKLWLQEEDGALVRVSFQPDAASQTEEETPLLGQAKQQGAAEGQQVADLEGNAAREVHRQDADADQAQKGGENILGPRLLLADRPPQKRHHHNVCSGDEGVVGGGGVLQRHRLHIKGEEQKGPDQKSALPVLLFELLL